MGKGIETQFFVPVENNLRGLLASLLHKKEIRLQTLNLAHEYGFMELGLHLFTVYTDVRIKLKFSSKPLTKNFQF